MQTETEDKSIHCVALNSRLVLRCAPQCSAQLLQICETFEIHANLALPKKAPRLLSVGGRVGLCVPKGAGDSKGNAQL